MATLYVRKNRLWIAWYEGGKRISKSTGLLADDMAKGLKVKAQVEREVEGRRDLGIERPSTVGAFRKAWLAERRLNGVASSDDDEARLKHAKKLDPLELPDVTPAHIRDVVLALKTADEPLAPRTIRHVFSILRQMFKDAQVDGLIVANPCVLKSGVLPAKKDRDPTWRSGAIFTRKEAEQLISDLRIPEERRTLYALLFTGGLRIGEAAALRWRHYNVDAAPLGKLLVALSFNRKKRKEKGVKVEGFTREMPVHPTLAKALAAWKLGGWERYVDLGRAPGPDDLLLPSYRNQHLRDPVVYTNLQRDLETLGFRGRRTHDTRRTFISLAQEDGALPHILKFATHGAPEDIMGKYTTPTWESLCTEVGKLNIRAFDSATPSLHLLRTGTNGVES